MDEKMKQNPMVMLSVALQNKQPAVVATVIEVVGASPAKVGAQMVALDDGSTAGTVGGGKLEAAILADAQAALSDGQSRLKHYTRAEALADPQPFNGRCAVQLRVGRSVEYACKSDLAPLTHLAQGRSGGSGARCARRSLGVLFDPS
jgi:xanthine/CO dehydrogenase XdhC/CoxF family maturation factor